MAKRVTKAHNRHTANASESLVSYFRDYKEGHNKRPETNLDTLEGLANSDDGDPDDRKRLLWAVRTIRDHLAAGDARWAVYEAIHAGVLAHSLGWSEAAVLREEERADRWLKNNREQNERRKKTPDEDEFDRQTYEAAVESAHRTDPNATWTPVLEELARYHKTTPTRFKRLAMGKLLALGYKQRPRKAKKKLIGP